MSRRDKRLQELRNNPNNIRFEIIRAILVDHGFIETAPGGGSSHYTYHNGIYRITVPKNNPVNKTYVRQVIKIIDALEETK